MLIDMSKFPISRTKHPVWAKLSAIMEAFETYPSTEWVWWLDVDAIIMTPHIDLYELLLNPAALKAQLLAGQLLNQSGDVQQQTHEPLKTGEVYPRFRYPLT